MIVGVPADTSRIEHLSNISLESYWHSSLLSVTVDKQKGCFRNMQQAPIGTINEELVQQNSPNKTRDRSLFVSVPVLEKQSSIYPINRTV
jgi:hypothetical protein